MTHKNPIYYTNEQKEYIVKYKTWDSYICKDKETAIKQCMEEHNIEREAIIDVEE